MAKSDLIQIASYPNATEAELVRIVLEQHGIEACIDGASSNTMMSYIGSALGGVRILVRQSEAEKAVEIIESAEDQLDERGAPWFCGRCQVEVDADFDVCWSCGNARAEVEAPFPAKLETDRPDEEPAEQPAGGQRDRGPDVVDTNPYAAPRSMTAGAAETNTSSEPVPDDPHAEARLISAWRAAVLGLFLFPFSLYSMYLLIRAGTLTSAFSRRGRRRFYGALVLNIFAGFFWGGVMAGMAFH